MSLPTATALPTVTASPAPLAPGLLPRAADTFSVTASLLRLSPGIAGALAVTSGASGAAVGGGGIGGTGGAAAGAAGATGARVGALPAGVRSGLVTGATVSVHHSSRHHFASFILPPLEAAQTVIERIVRVIPAAIWIALAVALGLAAFFGASSLRHRRQARRQAGAFAAVSAAALTDALTGVLNRRGFTEAVDRELARARRYNRPFVFAYVDVRGLKAVNDSEGHLAGDELLKSVATLLKESARADDVVGRIGGDELGLLLAEQTPEGAEAVIRRITSQLPEARAEVGLRAPWDLTIGTASYPEDGSTFDELLAAADRRLYQQRGIALR